MPGGTRPSRPSRVSSAPVPSSAPSDMAGKTAVPVIRRDAPPGIPLIDTRTVSPTRAPRAASVRCAEHDVAGRGGGRPASGTATSEASGPGPAVTASTRTPLTWQRDGHVGAGPVRDVRVRATLAAAADSRGVLHVGHERVPLQPVQPRRGEQVDQAGGEHHPALSPAIPTAAAPTVVRTGTAVRPAPRCSASRDPPSRPATGPPERGRAPRPAGAAEAARPAAGPGAPPFPPGGPPGRPGRAADGGGRDAEQPEAEHGPVRGEARARLGDAGQPDGEHRRRGERHGAPRSRPPAAPISAARASPATVSCAGLIPSDRSAA